MGLTGILVSSFLGGMRAVTLTQIIILAPAYLIPAIWLYGNQTGVPVPQLLCRLHLEKVTTKEKKLATDPKALGVRSIFSQR